ncbi:MAG TPA: DUF2771 family protein [Pseudonocardiaceae bacterium]|nr:DUF2771 family protein [Pseudonocardiaceae bacterium]
MRRVVLCVVAVLAGVVVLSGCSVPVPDVTFYSSGHSVAAAPLQYCDAKLQHCIPHANPPVFLTVTPGNPVQVSAPEEFMRTPWQVAARYRDVRGKEYVVCSTIFANGARLAYTVTPPTGYQLVLVEVYQVSAVIGLTAQQQVVFANSGVWSLVATPRPGQQTELPKPGDNLCQST